MDSLKRIWAIAAMAFLSCAAIAQASPVELKNVAADAKWLVHVDADAARSSKVVQAFVQEVGKECPKAHERLRHLGKKLGLDDCKDLHGVTVYGTKIGPAHVLIVYGKFNKQALVERAEKAPGHKVVEYGAYKICTWKPHKGHWHGCTDLPGIKATNILA